MCERTLVFQKVCQVALSAGIGLPVDISRYMAGIRGFWADSRAGAALRAELCTPLAADNGPRPLAKLLSQSAERSAYE